MTLAHVEAEATAAPAPDYWYRDQVSGGSAGWRDAVIHDEQPLVETRLPKGMWAHHMHVLTLDDDRRVYAKAVDETDEGVLTGHLLADTLLDQLDLPAPEIAYDEGRDEVWVEEVPDARLPSSYPRYRSCPADIDADSLYDAVATKLLLGDTDIGRGGTVENILVAEDAYCVPMDFDRAGHPLEKSYRRVHCAKPLARHIDVPFSYDRVEDRAQELAEQVDMREFFHDIADNPYLSWDDEPVQYVVENVRRARHGFEDDTYQRGGWWPW